MYSADSKQAFRFDFKVISFESSLSPSFQKAWELKTDGR